MAENKRIFLSPPHMGGRELDFVHQAFESNYIAPVGPQINMLEKEFSEEVGSKYSAAVSSGTAALHLALRYCGVGRGDEVICSSLTFIASANAILYLGAKPLFVDSGLTDWNMDARMFVDTIKKRAEINGLPKAVVLVHLYGQSADIDPIKECCDQFGIALIEDAAEALGATYKGRAPGTYGMAGIFSFNGNKIITASNGGMVVSDDQQLIEKMKFWATQARDDAPHYEHSEMGYNYRMSNIVAAIGRGQLTVLGDRVNEKRAIFQYYKDELGDCPGISFMPEPEHGRSTRWLTCITVDEKKFGATREAIRMALEEENIESRPLWKPMHLQPLLKEYEMIGGAVSEQLFQTGLCLPSGTAMTDKDMDRIVSVIQNCRC